jgi:hypothetical protein
MKDTEFERRAGTDHSKTSQTAAILRYLRSGESITQGYARAMFQCDRLASRVWDARKRLHPGEEIISERIVTASGKRIARYSLKKQ